MKFCIYFSRLKPEKQLRDEIADSSGRRVSLEAHEGVT